MAYNINPTPTQGTGNAFGAVPGALSLPDPFGDLSKAFPALGAANTAAGTDLLSQLGGTISPATQNALKLASAQYGVGSGMGPLSGLSGNQLLGNIAGYSEGLQQKGMQNYASLIPTISATQTVSPALQTDIASRNATMAAAPSPTAAASYAKQLFDEYLAKTRGPAGGYAPVGGPAGGTGPKPPNVMAWPGTVVGGPGVGSTPAAPAPFDWFSSTFGRPAGGGAVPGTGSTYIGDPLADFFNPDLFSSPAGTVGAVGPGGLPGTEGEGGPASLGDVFSGGAGDILSELYAV